MAHIVLTAEEIWQVKLKLQETNHKLSRGIEKNGLIIKQQKP